MTFLMMVTAGWFAFSSASFVLHGRILAGKEDLIAKARLSYRSSIGELAEYERRFADTARTLEDFNGTIVDLKNRKAGLEREVAQLRRELRLTRNERAQHVATGESLRSELQQTEDHVRGLSRKNETLMSSLSSVKAELETAVAERNLALFQRDRMKRQVGDLETRPRRPPGCRTRRRATAFGENRRIGRGFRKHYRAYRNQARRSDRRRRIVDPQPGWAVHQTVGRTERRGGTVPAEVMRRKLTSLDTQLQYWTHLQGVLESCL